MEYLKRSIYKAYLALHCPTCNSNKWQFSRGGDESEALDCCTCKTIAPFLNWVTFIKRIGDDERHLGLVIVRELKNKGFYVKVDTSGRSNENIESVRFCAAADGGRSMAVLREAGQIVDSLKTDDCRECDFEGGGGRLKIYRGRGDADMWMKTSKIEDGVSHGATVFFSHDHVAAPHISNLMQAMLIDMKAHPI